MVDAFGAAGESREHWEAVGDDPPIQNFVAFSSTPRPSSPSLPSNPQDTPALGHVRFLHQVGEKRGDEEV